jgi:hypothetical protein
MSARQLIWLMTEGENGVSQARKAPKLVSPLARLSTKEAALHKTS